MVNNVSVTPQGLLIGEKEVPLYSGSLHYWRHDPAIWKSMLYDVKEMGFQIICTYMPWNVHELSLGKFDFGQKDPRKNLAAFLEICSEVGLYVLARPGPHINAELPWFGFPSRIVTDSRIQAVTVSGAPAVLPIPVHPFVMPSYASDIFYKEVGLYFDALSEVIKPYIYLRGPIVAFQVDNEMSFFFRMRSYDVDYSEESITLYQKRLREKYGDISLLNHTYGHTSSHNNFFDIKPPKSFDAKYIKDLPYYLDWAEYQEFYITYGITKVGALLEERGLSGVPYYHNFPVFYPQVPFRLADLERKIDIVGIDAYPQTAQYPELKLGCIYTSIMSRLPFIPEFLSGVWAWTRPLTASEQAFMIQTAFMYGIRAINYYMLAERDRWTASPLTRKGTRRDEYFSMISNWNRCLKQLQWEQFRPERDVLILIPRIYERLRYTAIEASFPYEFIMGVYSKLPQDLFSSESSLGGRDIVQRSMNAWAEVFRLSLEELGIPYGLGDCDISREQLSQYSLIIVPLFEWADDEIIKKLKDYILSGGHVLCGPRLPRWSITGQPLEELLKPEDPINGVEHRVEFELEDVPSTQSGLWAEGVDLWVQSDQGTADYDTSTIVHLKSDQAPPFIRHATLGKGEITLVSAVFPAKDELKDGTDAYRIWATWLKPILSDAGVVSHWDSSNKAIECSILSGNGKRIFCAANPTPYVQEGLLTLPNVSAWHLVNPWEQTIPENFKNYHDDNYIRSAKNGENINEGACLTAKLDPWTVAIWEVS